MKKDTRRLLELLEDAAVIDPDHFEYNEEGVTYGLRKLSGWHITQEPHLEQGSIIEAIIKGLNDHEARLTFSLKQEPEGHFRATISAHKERERKSFITENRLISLAFLESYMEAMANVHLAPKPA